MENKRVKPQPKKNLWKPEEDLILKKYVETHGEGNWATVSQQTGLMRGGKSCRLRWKNYLRPDIKRGEMSEEEEDLIIRMHKLLGNRWSLIAGRIPGRTDNEVKNYWNTHLNKKTIQSKRKVINSSSNDDQSRETTNKRIKTDDPIIPNNNMSSSETQKDKTEDKSSSSIINNPLMADKEGFNYPTFEFDDEAFTDSFVFFEEIEALFKLNTWESTIL
ncbi:hypothetical protein UlMin_003020 [Ulmus minor]